MNPKNLALVAAAAISVGCMQTEPGGDKGNPDVNLPEDKNRSAGATSSTNWPAEIGTPRQISVYAKAESLLVLTFGKRGETAADPVNIPVQVAGRVILYRASTVPAYQDLDTSVFPFPMSDSVVITSDLVSKVARDDGDSIYLNINVLSDTMATWIFGIGYDKKSKRFFETPLSIQTETRAGFQPLPDTIKGVLDPQLSLPKPKLSGKSVLSFYIPGSPYFKSVQADSLTLGPIPDGDYQLRLLRVTYAGDKETGTEIESFEIQSSKLADNNPIYVFKTGALVFSYRTQSTLLLRPDW